MRAEERRRRILEILAETYPDAKCELNFTTPFELLVATILSAQSTDKRVNMVTERLFAKYNTPEAFAALPYEVLEEEIKEIGLYRNKAKHIIEMSRRLLEAFDGEVPQDRDALQTLPGVGRKTANVVVSNAFGIPAIAVDTHVFRVANRLGLARGAKTPLETEKQLMRNIPRELWSAAHHWLIHHGRRVCHARNPRCGQCPLLELCPEGKRRTGAAPAAPAAVKARRSPGAGSRRTAGA
ncbi:MAG: endonuclease III [Firmicutes bacterium]|nr:endonuclease III [Bacillota bacterium]MBO2520910.1 endonuclease III [Bacillota bacterium]